MIYFKALILNIGIDSNAIGHVEQKLPYGIPKALLFLNTIFKRNEYVVHVKYEYRNKPLWT